MNVTVARPFNNANTTYFHVHAAGCRDLAGRRYAGDQGWTIDAANRGEVVEDAYYDQIHNDHAGEDAAQLIADYESDFTFHPCTAALRTNPNPTTAEEATVNTNTNTITADPKFARLIDELDGDVIEGVGVFTLDDGNTLESAPHPQGGWLVRDDDGNALSPILTKWECAFLVRDWDGEALAAEPTDERKVHA